MNKINGLFLLGILTALFLAVGVWTGNNIIAYLIDKNKLFGFVSVICLYVLYLMGFCRLIDDIRLKIK